MRFRTKLVLLLVLVAVIPVSLAGLLSARANEREMRARIAEYQRETAQLAAEAIDDVLQNTAAGLLQSTRYIQFDRFEPAERAAALAIPHRQFADVDAVALLDSTGQQLTAPVHDPAEKRPFDLDAFARHLPLEAALQAGRAFGPVYFVGPKRSARIGLAIAFELSSGRGRWVLAAELDLSTARVKLLRAARASHGLAWVIDSRGRVVLQPEGGSMLGESMAERPLIARGLAAHAPSNGALVGPEGQAMAATFVPVPTLGGGLVVAEPEQQAFASATRIRTATFFWMGVCLLLAVFGGVLFARGVSRPLVLLAEGARALGEGRLERRFAEGSADEIGQLAHALNTMASELQASFDTIRIQADEIRAWNEELKQRVEDRTRELKRAQDQIVRSQKMAAAAELSAGVSHEINNPLTGLLGFLQMKARKSRPEDPDHKILESMVDSAQRIQEVVASLQRFAAQDEDPDRVRLDLNLVADQAATLIQSRLGERRIQLDRQRHAEPLWMNGDPAALGQALGHVVDNAIEAMPKGGVLRLATAAVEDGAVKIMVGDTGVGIAPEYLEKIFEPFYSRDGAGRGLGLSVAHRIVEDHGGRIEVDSRPGQGTTFELIFPAVRRELHLR